MGLGFFFYIGFFKKVIKLEKNKPKYIIITIIIINNNNNNNNNTNKIVMHSPESVLQNETQILRDFEMQTDCLITARRPDLMIRNKIKRIVYFAVEI